MLNKLRLLTPGPTPMPEEVRLALAKDMIHHRKADFVQLMGQVQAGLQYLFGTQEQVLPLSCSGTGAMYAAVTNIFAPGEKVLVIEGGKFGERWREIAQAHGLQVVVLVQEPGLAVTAAAVEQALADDPDIRGVLVQASETSTGVLHPIEALGLVTKKSNAFLVVDGISAVGVSPCPMDAWHIDCLLTGSQKGLMLPPGLAFISMSSRVRSRVQELEPQNFYFNLLGEYAKSLQQQTLFTSAVNLIQGLAVTLDLFTQTTLEAIYRKQWALTQMTRTGIKSLGLEPLAPSNFTWGLTSIKLPAGVDASQVLKVAADEYGVIMAGGQGELKHKVLRLGHMGYVDWSDISAGLYALHQGLLSAGGYSAAQNYLEDALKAYEDALLSDFPGCEKE